MPRMAPDAAAENVTVEAGLGDGLGDGSGRRSEVGRCMRVKSERGLVRVGGKPKWDFQVFTYF